MEIGGGQWKREMALGFNNSVGTGGVLEVCLCLRCGGVDVVGGVCGVGDVGGEWVRGLTQYLERWGGVMYV